MVPLVTRAEWGARPPTSPQTTVPWSRRLGVTVHYTASSRDATPRDIQAYAQNTVGHSDIHYNVLVDWRGVAYEGRGWTIAAAHSEGENTTHVGIAFIGMDTDVTPAAETTIAALIQDVYTLAGRTLPELKGHQEMPGANTSCPGQRLMALVRRLRDGGGVEDMTPEQDQLLRNIERIATCWDAMRDTVGVRYIGSKVDEPVRRNPFVQLLAAATASEAREKLTLAALEALAGNGGPDVAPILARIDERTAEVLAELAEVHQAQLAERDAEVAGLRAELERLTAATPQG